MVAQGLKHLPAMRETWAQSLGQEDPLEKEMATHSSILAWRIPWTKEPGGLQSTGSQRVKHDWETSLAHFVYIYMFFVYIQGAYAYTHRISAFQDEMSSSDWSLNYLNVFNTTKVYTENDWGGNFMLLQFKNNSKYILKNVSCGKMSFKNYYQNMW